LPNIESTILENWPGPQTTESPRSPVYHFAVKQEGVNLDFHIAQFFKGAEVAFHFFNDFEELLLTCQRHEIDAVIIGGRGDFLPEVELIRLVKQNVFLSIIPVLMYHPEPDDAIIVAAYENGVEDFLYGPWRERLAQVRVRRTLDRNRRDIAVNPSTHLPGPNLIEKEIARQMELGEQFAVCYADLDNFKAFNDYYGYARGDKVIRLTARIIKDIVFDVCREGFVGHIAGDDFIFVIPSGEVDTICGNILSTFDSIVVYQYEQEDRDRGFIVTESRRGEREQFPILSMSIAVVINRNGTFEHVGELSRMLADLKKYTKMKDGSNYMVERRSKY